MATFAKRAVLCVVGVLSMAVIAPAQTPDAMRPAGPVIQPMQGPAPAAPGRPFPSVREDSVQSESVGRAVRYRVILPPDYDRTPERYVAIYLLHGLMGDFADWESRTRIVDHLRAFPAVVVMPDGGDAWYTNSAGDPKERVEDCIIKDVIPDVERKYRVIRSRQGRAVVGLSMGGYGALKFGLKYPGTFAFSGSFSGALTIARDPEFGKTMTKYYPGMQKIFGPAGSPTRAENDIYALAKKADPARMPYFYVDCGTEDGLLASNREFVAVLQQQKIAYEYRELPGGHTWTYWDHQFPQMLHVLAERLRVQAAAGQ